MSEQKQDQRTIRDARQAAISDVLADPLRIAIENHLPSQAIERCALEDVNAVIEVVVEGLDNDGLELVNRDNVAGYLLTHVGGDETDPWQAGNNHAMREAARMIQQRWDALSR